MTIFTFLLVFSVGAVTGWLIELVYRTFVSQKKLVNPGFLSGPYLPLYGFGAVILFYLSTPDMPIYYRALFFLIVLTVLEWVTGEIFLHFFNLRLWDYSKQKWNYKGLICPLFSVFWTILALVFYFFAYPGLKDLTRDASEYVFAYLGLGFFYGIFSEDVVVSFHLAARLSTAIKAEVEKQKEKLQLHKKDISSDKLIVDFRNLKLQLRKGGVQVEGFSRFLRFFNPFNSFTHAGKDRVNLQQSINSYLEGKWRK